MKNDLITTEDFINKYEFILFKQDVFKRIEDLERKINNLEKTLKNQYNISTVYY